MMDRSKQSACGFNALENGSTYRGIWSLAFAMTLVFLGCAKTPPPPADVQNLADNANVGTKSTSLQVSDAQPGGNQTSPALSETLTTYREAKAYSDETELLLTYHFDDGRTEVSKTVFRLQFARPNKFTLLVASEDNSVAIVSDGRQIESRIIDPVTGNFDGQVVLRDAPETLTIPEIYKSTELVDPLTPGEMISALMGAPTSLDMTTLGLLLSEGRLATLVESAHPVGETNAAGDKLYEAKEPDGTYQFWIDANSGLVNKINFPPTTTDLPRGLSRIELASQHNNARFEVVDSDFGINDEGQQVSHFVMPPLPPTTELLGKEIAPLEFEDSTEQKLVIDNREDQISVVTWFHDHPASRVVIDQLELVRARHAGAKVRFVAVQVDAAQDVLQRWNVDLKTCSDPKALGRELLKVEQAPTTVVLGANNVVHYFEIGANPNIGNDVAVVIERLLGGNNVAEETATLMQQTRQAYKRQLALAKSGDGWVEEVETEIPDATEPTKLKLTKKWTNDEIDEPGNLLSVPGRTKQCLVVEGWNRIAIVDATGKLVRRIPLELAEDEGITVLRAGKGERDRALFAAATRGGKYAYVFDFGGKLVMQYPRIGAATTTVSDLTVGDLDGDDLSELIVGWQGDQGVQAVSLTGKQLWTNRVARGVVSLGIVDVPGSKRAVSLAGEQGPVFLVDDSGRTLREVRLGQASVHQAISWPGSARGFESVIGKSDKPTGDEAAVHCCLALSATGHTTVIGVNEKWQAIWDYALPPGVYRHQVDAIQSIELPKTGHTWLFAGAEGSIHFVSADGKFRDSFRVGKHIRGIGGLTDDEGTVLLVATDGEVAAYQVAE